MPKQTTIDSAAETFPIGTILSGPSGQLVSFDELVRDLATVRVVYVGEVHDNQDHHLIQTRLIEALYQQHPDLTVGMEMFDHRYDPVLARWSAGELDREAFIQKTHWYARGAGWGFDFDLYAPIFETIKDKGIPLVGLNVPFGIQSKIRAGGIENLLPEERLWVASEVDTGNEAHRAYLEAVFNAHSHHQGSSFEYFYEVQCAWEDTMAESIARKLTSGPMIVVIGNGHIQYKYGVPNRAFHRNQAPFRTVYLAPVGATVDLKLADYIWVTP
ncbi:MAG: ChaN family lipoprotein [Desulfobacterales bacterium]